MGNPVGTGMFKAALADTPREVFNWRLVVSVICFGLMVCLSQKRTRSETDCATGCCSRYR
jgi:hypothetical protein